jgi:hypothetical protein
MKFNLKNAASSVNKREQFQLHHYWRVNTVKYQLIFPLDYCLNLAVLTFAVAMLECE